MGSSQMSVLPLGLCPPQLLLLLCLQTPTPPSTPCQGQAPPSGSAPPTPRSCCLADHAGQALAHTTGAPHRTLAAAAPPPGTCFHSHCSLKSRSLPVKFHGLVQSAILYLRVWGRRESGSNPGEFRSPHSKPYVSRWGDANALPKILCLFFQGA